MTRGKGGGPGAAAGGDGGRRRFTLASLLRPFGNVRVDEAGTTLLLVLTVFLLLCSYYILKVAREPLVMTDGTAEIKRYAAAGQAILLVAVIRAYSWVAERFDRMKLVAVVNLFFAANLIGFFVLGWFDLPLGVPFFIWVGIFNVTVLAQFWAFAADVFTREQGKRLFGILGIGSSVGAVAGSFVAALLLEPLGVNLMLPLVAGMLVLCVALVYAVHRREDRLRQSRGGGADDDAAAPVATGRGLRLILDDRYLILVALLTLFLNWVNTNGEYILDTRILQEATQLAAAQPENARAVEQYIGEFRAQYFGWVNVATLLLQAFMVSRLMQYLGERVSLFVLPVFAMGGYSLMAVLPVLSVITAVTGVENSLSYSLQNTARHSLFLVTSREAKFTGKTFIDTFIWRAGDVLAAAGVGLGQILALQTRGFIWLNLLLIGGWLAVMIGIARIHRARTEELDHGRRDDA